MIRQLFVVFVIAHTPGFLLCLVMNLTMGPVTPGLALMRAIFWPFWIVFGWPHGTPLPMD